MLGVYSQKFPITEGLELALATGHTASELADDVTREGALVVLLVVHLIKHSCCISNGLVHSNLWGYDVVPLEVPVRCVLEYVELVLCVLVERPCLVCERFECVVVGVDGSHTADAGAVLD